MAGAEAVRPEQRGHDFEVGQADVDAAAAKSSGFVAMEQEQAQALVPFEVVFRTAGDLLVLPCHRLAHDESWVRTLGGVEDVGELDAAVEE